MCNAAVRVFSDVHSENSSLAGSEEGCEKLKKPQQSTKTEPDGVKKHEGNFGKSKKAALSVREGGRTRRLLLLPEFVSEKTQRTQLVKNTEVCVFKTAEVNFRAEGLGFVFFFLTTQPIFRSITEPERTPTSACAHQKCDAASRGKLADCRRSTAHRDGGRG